MIHVKVIEIFYNLLFHNIKTGDKNDLKN